MIYDYLLVGGGLQNALIALSLFYRRPQCSLALIEKEPTLGGNHTWSFHQGDIPSEAYPWFSPLIVQTWPGFEVRFPSGERHLELSYGTVTSERLDRVLRKAIHEQGKSELFLGQEVKRLEAQAVVLQNGQRLQGRLVVDARGPGTQALGGCGYQKFHGLEIELDSPQNRKIPLIMDATVEQKDGYRFMYVLPFSHSRWLVEETYFSNTPDLDPAQLRQGILAYLNEKQVGIGRILRQESGVLPMPWTAPPSPPLCSPFAAGYQGGFFHPATGYSLPIALRLAQALSSQPVEQVFGKELQTLIREHDSQRRFCHRLNWMLFNVIEPQLRWHLFDTFHRLPPQSISRFYALQTSWSDRLRLLSGRPPRGLRWGRLLSGWLSANALD